MRIALVAVIAVLAALGAADSGAARPASEWVQTTLVGDLDGRGRSCFGTATATLPLPAGTVRNLSPTPVAGQLLPDLLGQTPLVVTHFGVLDRAGTRQATWSLQPVAAQCTVPGMAAWLTSLEPPATLRLEVEARVIRASRTGRLRSIAGVVIPRGRKGTVTRLTELLGRPQQRRRAPKRRCRLTWNGLGLELTVHEPEGKPCANGWLVGGVTTGSGWVALASGEVPVPAGASEAYLKHHRVGPFGAEDRMWVIADSSRRPGPTQSSLAAHIDPDREGNRVVSGFDFSTEAAPD